MNIPIPPCSKSRFAAFWLLNLILLTQAACSPSANWQPPHQEDLSKIFVTPIATNAKTILPERHVNSGLMLTNLLRNRLGERNWLQTDSTVHSLRLTGMILTYRDATLDLEGQLQDNQQLLAYSRLKLHLEPTEDWEQGMEWLSGQLLNELMGKLCALQQPIYSQFCIVIAPPTPPTHPCPYGNCDPWPLPPHREPHPRHEVPVPSHPAPTPHRAPETILDTVPRSDTAPHKPIGSTTKPDTSISSRAPKTHGSTKVPDTNSSSPSTGSNSAVDPAIPASTVAPHSHNTPHHQDTPSMPAAEPQSPGGSSPAANSTSLTPVLAPTHESTPSSSYSAPAPAPSTSSTGTASPSSSTISSPVSAPSQPSAPSSSYSAPASAPSTSSTGTSSPSSSTISSPVSAPSQPSTPSSSYSAPASAPSTSSTGTSSPSSSTISSPVSAPSQPSTPSPSYSAPVSAPASSTGSPSSSPVSAPSQPVAPSTSSAPAQVSAPSSTGGSSGTGGHAQPHKRDK